MTRSALVGLIHDHTMKLASVSYDNSAATTLMSTDADTLEGIAEMVHEIWAQIVEVLIGIWLLAGQVGWIWPLLIFLIYCKCRIMRLHASILPRTHTDICSMLSRESVCCEAFTTWAKGME